MRAACLSSEPRLDATIGEGEQIFPATAQGRETLGKWYYIHTS